MSKLTVKTALANRCYALAWRKTYKALPIKKHRHQDLKKDKRWQKAYKSCLANKTEQKDAKALVSYSKTGKVPTGYELTYFGLRRKKRAKKLK